MRRWSANSAIAVAKTVAAAISGSSAMLAEALHSFADTGNQALLLLGMRRRADKPVDEDHPFGHRKEPTALYAAERAVRVRLGAPPQVPHRRQQAMAPPRATVDDYVRRRECADVRADAVALRPLQLLCQIGCCAAENQTAPDQRSARRPSRSAPTS